MKIDNLSLETSPNHQLESVIEETLCELRGSGMARNVVKDGSGQLSPPEVATWTGKVQQLALLQSGRDAWLEVREFWESPNRRQSLPLGQVRDRAEFGKTIVKFGVAESA